MSEGVNRFTPLFRPRTVAIVGASANSAAQGNRFIRMLRQAGFSGSIYPIHPSEPAIEGLQAFPSLAQTPEPIDYAIVAVAGEKVPGLLAAAAGRVRFAQVMSSGFAESEGGRELENSLLDAARSGGMRLLGPNCMGIHSTRGRLTFVAGGPDVQGSVGVMSQSGGLSIDMVLRGRVRGLRYSEVVSLGNCADLGPDDLLEYFLADPATGVIGAYLEHIRDGRRFFDLLRGARATKPVVILKGGRTRQGQRAAASHTGSLASNDQIWRALAKQTGSVLVDTLEDFLDVLVAFQAFTPREAPPTGRVLLLGNGGGASVLATDYLARRGLDVAPLDAPATEALTHLGLPAGASIANPIDVPANVLQRNRGAVMREILELLADNVHSDAILMHVNLAVILSYKEVDMLGNFVEAAVRAKEALRGRTHLSLALRANGEAELEDRRRASRLQAMEAGIAVFDELSSQAMATAAVHDYERFRYLRQAAAS
ncbi:MAG: CoA-binding protein [Candidatus Binataceae bacterium]|nr:CoA-binding protein [Candidatus Binataceae bacterium]